jgi:TIR domain
MPNNQKLKDFVAPEKIGVFISYNHADLTIANVLRQSLIALSSDLVPFIDHVGLKPGDEYEQQLAQSISASQWFLMICSGPPRLEKDMGWCLYEAGQFRSKLPAEGSDELFRSRFVAIHDDERPSQLAKFQSVPINSKDIYGHTLDLKTERLEEEATILFESTPAYTFFETLIKQSRQEPLRDLTDPNVRSLIRTNTRVLIRAFIQMQSEAKLPEVVFQPRISFRLPAAADPLPSRITPDTPVVGDGASLSQIFGITGLETTWGKIKACSRDEDGNDPLWVSEIEAAAEQVSLDRVPNQPDGLCLAKADGKFYAVLFARYEPFRSGARICYIVFVPRRARHFDVRQRTSILLSALILSIRFRQRILPFIDELQNLPRKKKIDGLSDLERELLEIETESQEFGLRIPKNEDDEEPPLVREFREGESQSFVRQTIQSWQLSRRALADVFKSTKVTDPNADRVQAGVDGADIAVKELQKVQQANGKLIQLVTEELLLVEKVAAGEKLDGSGSPTKKEGSS